MSLLLLCNFGGVGARVRRGFGSLVIAGLEGIEFSSRRIRRNWEAAVPNPDRLSFIDPTKLAPTLPHWSTRYWERRTGSPIHGGHGRR